VRNDEGGRAAIARGAGLVRKTFGGDSHLMSMTLGKQSGVSGEALVKGERGRGRGKLFRRKELRGKTACQCSTARALRTEILKNLARREEQRIKQTVDTLFRFQSS